LVNRDPLFKSRAPRRLSRSRTVEPPLGGSGDGSDDGSDGTSDDGAVAYSSRVPAAAPWGPAAGRTPLSGGAGAPDARAAGLPLAGDSTVCRTDLGASRGGLAGRSPLLDGASDGSDDGASADGVVARPAKQRRAAAPFDDSTVYPVGRFILR